MVVARAFCDILVDVFLQFLFFSCGFSVCTWVAGTRFGVEVVCVYVPWWFCHVVVEFSELCFFRWSFC